MNRGSGNIEFTFNAQTVGIDKHSKLRDLWLHQELGGMGSARTFTIPKHGIVVLKVYR